MVQCATCHSHRRSEDERCPWCDDRGRPSIPLTTAAALLLGLTMVGCPAPQPKYGTTVSDTAASETDLVDPQDP